MSVANILSMAGGLGLFLFGIRTMGDGLENAAGAKLKRMLEVLTGNRFLAVLVGFVVTAIIQSSTATTVMVVGFVNAGMMSLAQAVGAGTGTHRYYCTYRRISAPNFERRYGWCLGQRYTHACNSASAVKNPAQYSQASVCSSSASSMMSDSCILLRDSAGFGELSSPSPGVASAPAVRYYPRYSHDRRTPEPSASVAVPDSRHAGTRAAQVLRFRPLRSEYRNLPHGTLLDRRREEKFKACRSYPPALQSYRHGHIHSYRFAHSLCRVDRRHRPTRWRR